MRPPVKARPKWRLRQHMPESDHKPDLLSGEDVLAFLRRLYPGKKSDAKSVIHRATGIPLDTIDKWLREGATVRIEAQNFLRATLASENGLTELVRWLKTVERGGAKGAALVLPLRPASTSRERPATSTQTEEDLSDPGPSTSRVRRRKRPREDRPS